MTTERQQLAQIAALVGVPTVELAHECGVNRSRLSLYLNDHGDLSAEQVERVRHYLFSRLTEKFQQLSAMKEAVVNG